MPKEEDKDLKESIKWSDNLSDISHQLNIIAFEFEQMSHAFYLVGNSEMGKKMFDYSLEIKHLSEQVRKAVGDKINYDYKKSQEGLAFTLGAVLNSILPKEENNEEKTTISRNT